VSVGEGVHQTTEFYETVKDLMLYACGFGFGASQVRVV